MRSLSFSSVPLQMGLTRSIIVLIIKISLILYFVCFAVQTDEIKYTAEK